MCDLNRCLVKTTWLCMTFNFKVVIPTTVYLFLKGIFLLLTNLSVGILDKIYSLKVLSHTESALKLGSVVKKNIKIYTTLFRRRLTHLYFCCTAEFFHVHFHFFHIAILPGISNKVSRNHYPFKICHVLLTYCFSAHKNISPTSYLPAAPLPALLKKLMSILRAFQPILLQKRRNIS